MKLKRHSLQDIGAQFSSIIWLPLLKRPRGKQSKSKLNESETNTSYYTCHHCFQNTAKTTEVFQFPNEHCFLEFNIDSLPYSCYK